ncbi:MAG: YncE family protein [Actinobacteria bacterium]|nr:YncE family protein [Actinomycetota bacterium]
MTRRRVRLQASGLALVVTLSLLAGQIALADPKSVTHINTPCPGDIAINQTTSRAYIYGCGANVSVADLTTNRIIGNLHVYYAPWDVAVDPVRNRIFVIQEAEGVHTVWLDVFDGRTNAWITEITLPSHSHAVAVNSRTGKIYVTNYDSDSVTVIDATTNTIVDTFDPSPGELSHPYDVVVNEATNRVYVSESYNYPIPISDYVGKVFVVDGANDSALGSISLQDKESVPARLAIDEKNQRLYAATYFSPHIYAIDTANNTLKAKIDIAPLWPGWVTIDPRINRVYVSAGSGDWPNTPDQLITIDEITNGILSRTRIDGVAQGVAQYQQGYEVLVASEFGGYIDVLTEDPNAPVLSMGTPTPSVMHSGSQVTGTVTDDLSGVRDVEVTFAGTGLTVRSATLNCATTANLSCTWTAKVPDLPGAFTVRSKATDRAGATQDIGSLGVITVIP